MAKEGESTAPLLERARPREREALLSLLRYFEWAIELRREALKRLTSEPHAFPASYTGRSSAGSWAWGSRLLSSTSSCSPPSGVSRAYSTSPRRLRLTPVEGKPAVNPSAFA